jgi:hypothetical protein
LSISNFKEHFLYFSAKIELLLVKINQILAIDNYVKFDL